LIDHKNDGRGLKGVQGRHLGLFPVLDLSQAVHQNRARIKKDKHG